MYKPLYRVHFLKHNTDFYCEVVTVAFSQVVKCYQVATITYFLCLSLFDYEVVSSMAVDTVDVQCGC